MNNDSRAVTEYVSVTLETKLIHPDAKIPFKSRVTDAGYDLYSVEDKILKPNRATVVGTGIIISAPPGYYYTVEGRSSLWMRGIFPNRGIIDSSFIGELVVSLVNVNDSEFVINCGDRIAQIILNKQYNASFEIVDEFSGNYSIRGTKGFGSSGQ